MAAPKAPGFFLYLNDYENDPTLRMSSWAAQGLWMRLLCRMSDSPERGYLLLPSGKPMTATHISRIVGGSEKEIEALLDELEDNDVSSKREDGAIFNRRMVRDEQVRSGNRERKAKSRSVTGQFGSQGEEEGEDTAGHDSSSDDVTGVVTEDVTQNVTTHVTCNVTPHVTPSFSEDSLETRTRTRTRERLGLGLGNDSGSARDFAPITDAEAEAWASSVGYQPDTRVLQDNANRVIENLLAVPGHVPPDVGDPAARVPSAGEMARRQAHAVSQRLAGNSGVLPPVSGGSGRATGQPHEENQAGGDLLLEIGLATPSAVANKWTAGIESNTSIMGAILGAVETEAREQHLTEREAGLWLLKQTRRSTERVMREVGWQKFWTLGRMVRFFGQWEYRNPERFDGGKDDGAGEARAGVSDVRAVVQRRALAKRERGHGRGDAGSGADRGASEPSSRVQASGDYPRVDGQGAGRVPGRAGGTDTAGTGAGVQPGSTGEPLRFPKPSATRRVFVPE